MTRNRTVIESVSAFGTQLMVLMIFVLATGVAISNAISAARHRMRRIDMRVRRRAARRSAA